MPPRHHYWTIILEGKPTAFRAHLQEELLPTLRQLQARHPDAVMKWFARGRLWDSQDQERADALSKRRPTGAPGGRRPRDWRPGGEHKDPRDRFKIPRDEKRRRFAENLRRDRKEEQGENARPPRPEWRGPLERAARPPQFRRPPRTDRPPHGDRQGKPPWKREDRDARDERPWKRDRQLDRSPGTPPGDQRSPQEKPSTCHRPPSRRPAVRGGRPPGQSGRLGPRPQGGRKPGGGGGKGGGGSRGGGGRGR
jgi:uncharacterized membrane protein YgcG